MSTASINLCANYVGRFAPSPTGPLHFGSLVAAVASYCDAKQNNGKWLVRMEDLDKPREAAEAADNILRHLEAFGFEWDGDGFGTNVMYQSQRSDIYQDYFEQLRQSGFIYSCTCSRKEIADSSVLLGIDGVIYPKTCFKKRHDLYASENHASANLIGTASWRINLDDAKIISFHDVIQGAVSQNLPFDIGDFILKRKDGIFAYHLAVVVDDAEQGVTHVVRGADLLDSTPRQIYLQKLLGLQTPHYAHVPVVTNGAGEKLSKQTLAQPISISAAGQQLFDALRFLGQNPPPQLHNAALGEVWQWAIINWRLSKVPIARSISI